jgi:hypothetical protein
MKALLFLLLTSCGCSSLDEKEESAIAPVHKLVVVPPNSAVLIVPDYMLDEFLDARRKFPYADIENAYPSK